MIMIYYSFNFDHPMNLDYSLVKVGGMGLFVALLVSQIKQLRKAISDRKQLQKAEIKTLEAYQAKIDSKDKSRLNLIKLKPYYFQPQTHEISVHTAEKVRFEPSDVKLVELMKKKLSSRINERTNTKHIPVQWFAKLGNSTTPQNQKYRIIQGFGVIQGDFFDIKREYVPKKLTFWQSIRNWFVQTIHLTSAIVEELKPLTCIFGPIVGVLKYQINLMKQWNIVAVCNFEDGKIIPTVTSTSKSEILNYYQNLIHEKYVKVGGLLIGTILLGRWFWSDIKAGLNAMKVRNNKLNSKYFKMENPVEDKMCIICYNNSRNMIFFDCRHMIMCNQCSEAYDSDVCPYCKMEIDDIKPVIGIP